MVPSEIEPSMMESDNRFANLRGVQWRVNLGVLPFHAPSIDDLRKTTTESWRRALELATSKLFAGRCTSVRTLIRYVRRKKRNEHEKSSEEELDFSADVNK
ncbi:unnamed protein product [Microthlaspi erraticum]|uniref:Uncharacterized protein n=1 Tax=Microthlaspi erraticum TaxID=1685480 RepID=A0A6D2JLZ8_9BRAS|nr:unnamed protein product [Microthlaspi erraticum]